MKGEDEEAGGGPDDALLLNPGPPLDTLSMAFQHNIEEAAPANEAHSVANLATLSVTEAGGHCLRSLASVSQPGVSLHSVKGQVVQSRLLRQKPSLKALALATQLSKMRSTSTASSVDQHGVVQQGSGVLEDTASHFSPLSAQTSSSRTFMHQASSSTDPGIASLRSGSVPSPGSPIPILAAAAAAAAGLPARAFPAPEPVARSTTVAATYFAPIQEDAVVHEPALLLPPPPAPSTQISSPSPRSKPPMLPPPLHTAGLHAASTAILDPSKWLNPIPVGGNASMAAPAPPAAAGKPAAAAAAAAAQTAPDDLPMRQVALASGYGRSALQAPAPPSRTAHSHAAATATPPMLSNSQRQPSHHLESVLSFRCGIDARPGSNEGSARSGMMYMQHIQEDSLMKLDIAGSPSPLSSQPQQLELTTLTVDPSTAACIPAGHGESARTQRQTSGIGVGKYQDALTPGGTCHLTQPSAASSLPAPAAQSTPPTNCLQAAAPEHVPRGPTWADAGPMSHRQSTDVPISRHASGKLGPFAWQPPPEQQLGVRAGLGSAQPLDGGGGAAGGDKPQGNGMHRSPSGVNGLGSQVMGAKVLRRVDTNITVPDVLRKQLLRGTRFSFYFNHRRYDVGAFLRNLFWDVWSPGGFHRLLWDITMLICMQYVIYVTPYIVAFNLPTSDLSTPIAEVDLTINSIFMADVVMNFRTAYIDEDGREVRNRLRIAKNYLCTWFVIDTVTSLPWDNMFGDNFGILKALRLLRIARFVRALRLIQMLRLSRYQRMRNIMARLDEIAGHHMMRIAIFVWTAFSLVHWAACTFYFVADLYGPDADTWITRNLEPDSQYVVRYIFALYWAVTTMTTVGYGDITGVTVGEKLVAMFTMVAGASIFAYFMGAMATILAALNTADVRVTRKKAMVTEFVRHRKLPRRLSDRLHNYFAHVVQRQVHSDESELIHELPSSLRMQVTWHLHREVLEQVPFFQGKPPQFTVALAPYLKLEYYSPGDVIVRQGNLGHEMFFVLSGQVELRLYEEGTDHSSSSAYLHELGGSAAAGGTGGGGGGMTASLSHPHFTQVRTTEDGRGSGGSGVGVGRRRRQKRTLVDKLTGRRRYLKVELLDEDLQHLQYRKVGVLDPGEYFGEYTCFFNEPRPATAVALDFCELYSLSRFDLEHVVAEFPEMAEDLAFLLRDPGEQVPNTLEEAALSMREQMGMPSLAVPSRTDMLAAASVALTNAPTAGTPLSRVHGAGGGELQYTDNLAWLGQRGRQQ